LPPALSAIGLNPVVICPSYGRFQSLPGAERLTRVEASFGGATETADVYRVAGSTATENLVIDHPLTHGGHAGEIYVDDGHDRPFATDAGKFAFFCAAVAAYLRAESNDGDVVHLHDWHAAFLLLLRARDPACRALATRRCVYTIHNLALQGVRPIDGDPSSLRAWYPTLDFDMATVGDPRYADCINPMAVGIRLADSVNTVSPGYVEEILRPSQPANGFFGGEGLEGDLQHRYSDGDLHGILNGCEYDGIQTADWATLYRELHATADSTGAGDKLVGMHGNRPRPLLTSIGRLTDQKISLLLRPVSGSVTALEQVLDALGEHGLMLLVGSGDPAIEKTLETINRGNSNFLFLRGYFTSIADAMYATGDLFLMPSSFEPCGISQMLAMRAGQPCVVHGVGGLRDTVRDGVTGFVSQGKNPDEQARQFVQRTRDAIALLLTQPDKFDRIRAAAAAERFTWRQAAVSYSEKLYAVTAS